MINPQYTSDLIKTPHGFWGREGGVSKGGFASLNGGTSMDDDPAAVIENRSRVQKHLGAAHFLSLYQTHSDICHSVQTPWAHSDRPKGDGLVTDCVGIALCVLTADCVPVLIYGQKDDGAPVIGACHAGWSGALKGVTDNTIDQMRALNATNIHAVIGPCIQQNSYEIGADFEEKFMQEDQNAAPFFSIPNDNGKKHFDLPGYVYHRLKQRIDSIEDCSINTYIDETRFFSHRRSTHRSEVERGNHMSVIVI